MEDISDLGREVVQRGFTALKTNIVMPGDPARVYGGGFATGGGTTDGTISTPILRHIETLIGTFRDAVGEEVGWMTFRVLKFISAQPPAAATGDSAAAAMPTRMRPPRSFDNGWWWDGIDSGEILIQKWNACGALHHPTRPMCGE